MNGDATNGADLNALRLVEMPDALGALGRVDLVDRDPHEDGVVRAFGLAHIAVDAFVRNH